jgi:hypothetical protein
MESLLHVKKIPSNIMIKSAYNLYEYKINRLPYLHEPTIDIYNFIFQNTDLDLDELEIEAKLGKFIFKGNSILGYEFIKEIFQIPIWDPREFSYKYDFVSGLEEEKFFLIWHFVDKESDNPQSSIKKIPPKNYKEIHYKSGKRKSQLIENNNVIREDIIKKEKKIHFNIRNNGMDFRITSCIEKKTDINDSDEYSINRDKFRISYEYQFFRIDFTIVNTIKNNSEPEITYEIELELLAQGIKSQYNYFKDYRNFEYLFKRFFENIFCLYELTQTDYYSDKLIDKENKFFGSIFGNYLEKNFDKNNLRTNL